MLNVPYLQCAYGANMDEQSQNRKGHAVKKMNVLGMVVVLGMVALLAGCATGAKPESLVQKQVEQFKAMMLAQNIDGLVALFSDKFEHYEWGNKAGAADFMKNAKEMGYLDGLEVDISRAAKTAEGPKFKVYPIEISGSFGSTTVELIFAKEGDAWKIIGLDASNL